MSDPYSVLGVSRTASDDEIKKAYRELARKYHPDNYKDNPLSDLASEKMKEVNEAYDTIVKERAGSGGSSDSARRGQQSSGYRQQTYHTNARGGNPQFYNIRTQINRRDYDGALDALESIPSSERGAEWEFLKGSAYYGKGWTAEARIHFENAARMDPANREYRQAVNMMNQATSYYGGYPQQQGGCTGCDMCSGLLCADCCCECMGGDLIRCC